MAARPGAVPAECGLQAGMSLAGAVACLTARFKEAGIDTPGLDARRLIAGCCGLSAGDVILRAERLLAPHETERLADFARRRLAREPVSRILGIRAFHGHDFEISPATLDPRPETETLVDGVLALIAEGSTTGGGAPRILDLGTGSGAILLALLAAVPGARGVGVDVSIDALAIARRNAVRLGLETRADWLHSDWLAAVDGRFDIIVSNPPYIARSEIAGLEPEVRLHDPISALDGGADGLDPYRKLVPACEAHIAAGGWLIFEIGSAQSDEVLSLGQTPIVGQWVDKRLWQDLAGKPRCVAMRHQS